MRDEYFDCFINKFGEPTHQIDVPEANIRQWRGKLPDQLLAYWREEGWCGYADGLFWTVDPDEYQDLVDLWLEDTFFTEVDTYHAIGRTAFGEIYLFGEQTGRSATLGCFANFIISMKNERMRKTADRLDWNVRTFFLSKRKEDCDLKDENKRPLFERALRKLGSLTDTEVYGFEPALNAGGAMRLENLAKLDLHTHFTILRQFATPDLSYCNLTLPDLP